jgi:GT2 family glycosyltransferase
VVEDSHLLNKPELPLVSVCIPAYNSENTLGETLEAVLAQDYPRLDIVVSDNQSTDRTKAIVQEYAGRGVRYCTPGKRLEWEANLPSYIGAYSNASFVLSQGRGEYLCLFHSDDLYEPSLVRQQVEVMLAHPQVGAVFSRMRMIGEDNRPIRRKTIKLPITLRRRVIFDFATLMNTILVHNNFLPTPSVMLRRSVIMKVDGFDERHFLTSADLEMWLRIARHGYEIAIIDQPLLKYRISQRQGSEQYNELRTTLADFFGVLDQYLSQPGVRAMVQPRPLALYELQRANDHVLCAMNFLARGRVVETRARLREALQWRHYMMAALMRPRLLVNLTVGAFFLVSTYVGLGSFVGRQVYRAHARRNVWWRKPAKR